MTRIVKKKRRKKLERAATAGEVIEAAAATGAALAHGNTMEAVGLAFLTLLPSGVLPSVLQRKASETRKWWDYVTMVDTPDETVRADIAAHLDNPDAQEAILSSLKALLETTNPEVLKPLSMLTREYVRQDKGPDEFFRGVARTLSDLVSGELGALRTLVRLVSEVEAKLESSFYAVDLCLAPEAGTRDEEHYLHHRTFDGRVTTMKVLKPRIPGAERLFHLLKANRLASDHPSGRWDIETGPWSLVIERQIVRRLDELLQE